MSNGTAAFLGGLIGSLIGILSLGVFFTKKEIKEFGAQNGKREEEDKT
jgi:hypothetical protein